MTSDGSDTRNHLKIRFNFLIFLLFRSQIYNVFAQKIAKNGENPFSTYLTRISSRHFGNPDFGLFWVPDPSLHIGSEIVMNINIDFKTLTMRINKNNKS